MFPWPAQVMCSQCMPAAIGGWGHVMDWGRRTGEDLFGVESEKKGRVQQVFCSRAGDEPGVGFSVLAIRHTVWWCLLCAKPLSSSAYGLHPETHP